MILTKVDLTLMRERSASDYRDALETTGRAARRMKSLTDGLLALARCDSGKMPSPNQSVKFHQLIDETTAMLRSLAQSRGVTLGLDLEAVTIQGADPDRLGQVVTNLVTNAIIYNREEGEVSITLTSENGNAILTIADTGVGIPEADLTRVFERFYRVDKARNRDTGGSGLGLAIVKSIVETHNGTIEVSSELGEGTKFVVSLPMNNHFLGELG